MTKAQKIKYKTSWYKTMLAKHGSEAAVKKVMQERQAKSRETYAGGGGFAALKKTNPDKLKEISSKGGRSGKQD